MLEEGINAILAALKLAERYNVELPIVNVIDAVINHEESSVKTASDLMGRNKKTESAKTVLDITFENAILKIREVLE